MIAAAKQTTDDATHVASIAGEFPIASSWWPPEAGQYCRVAG